MAFIEIMNFRREGIGSNLQVVRVSISDAEAVMHCVYCGVDYKAEDGCMCVPPSRTVPDVANVAMRVVGPWGEASSLWSLDAPPGRSPENRRG